MTDRQRAPRAVPLLDAEAAAAGDRSAVEAGDSWAGLMERAAGHLARGIVEVGGHGYGLRVALVVGKGNNGGDGWAAARRLRSFGAQAWVVSTSDLDAEMSDEATTNRRRYLDDGGRAGTLADLDAALEWCDVAVDCLLGTGATGAPRGDLGTAVGALNAAEVPVVACDVPTGVQTDDGQVPGEAVRADLTVTFGGWKRGLLLHPGAAYVGRVVVGDLGARYAPPEVTWSALTALGARPSTWSRDVDKRDRGVVLVVAGSVGMAGAAILAARGALAAGAGLVTVAIPEEVLPTVAQAVPPAMTVPLDGDGFEQRLADSDVVVCGPGLRPTARTREITDLLRAQARRLVLDADGLNVHRGEGTVLADHAGDLVLTPQSRELERLVGDPDDPDHGPPDPVAFAAEVGATVVAKGPGTRVCAPDGRVWVNPTGSPALGSGGSGDVLAGALGAAIASADDVPEAVARCVWWHGLAGDLAGGHRAERASSSELAGALPRAIGLTRRLADRRPAWPFDEEGWSPARPLPDITR